MKKNIQSVCFNFENCQVINVPIECFEKLDYNIVNDYFVSFNAEIVDNGHTSYGMFSSLKETPLQRLDQYNDVTSIGFKYTDNTSESHYVIWNDSDDQYNSYQSTIMPKYNKVKLSIDKGNLTYTFAELFTLPDGVQVKASDDKLYTIQSQENETYISLGINAMFKVTDNIMRDTYTLIE